MICKICGGSLNIKEGVYVCSNCHNKMMISAVCENIEVFILYTEVDEYGRRTKDSVIAQEIYNKLESSNVNVFYQRISADGLTGDNYQTACDTALSFAKIVIIIGSDRVYLHNLIYNYRVQLKNKIIIPIYSGIKTYDLPDEIKKLQSVNYDTLGAINDILKAVLINLNKVSDINFLTETHKNILARKKLIIRTVLFILFLVIGITTYIVCFTPYVLDSKKYEYAEELYRANQYTESLNLYLNLSNYKDSQSKAWDIYKKYSGYYKNYDNNFFLRLSIDESYKADIEVSYSDNNIINRCTGKFLLNGTSAEFQLTDSLNKNYNGEIELKNDRIILSLSEAISSENKNGYKKILFTFNNKTNENVLSKITDKQLSDWFLEPRKESYFINQGYRLTNLENTDKLNLAGFREIEDLGINLAIFYEFAINIENDIFLNYEKHYDDGIVMGVISRASTLIPDNIGKKSNIFVSNDVLYAPNYELWLMPTDLINITLRLKDENNTNKIESDTIVAAIPKHWISEANWNFLIEEFL